MVGLWHYPIPGFFLLAQFCVGILVALGNLVNNSVFLCLSDEDRHSSNDNTTANGKEIQTYMNYIDGSLEGIYYFLCWIKNKNSISFISLKIVYV